MKILVLGASGMLGHELMYGLSRDNRIIGTIRGNYESSLLKKEYSKDDVIDNFDVLDSIKLEKSLRIINPDIIINAVGVIKQRDEVNDSKLNISINALLPHILADISESIDARLIHMSTDCVFSGQRGLYTIKDWPDTQELYGRSKLLGEVSYGNCLTLRTSIIGLEIYNKRSLIEWYLSQKGRIRGYKNAVFSGFTTYELTRVIDDIITNFPELRGIYHVASEPIDKYSLLTILTDKLGRKDINVDRYEEFKCDRSLLADEFNEAIDYQPPDWEYMLNQLAEKITQRGDKF